MVVEIEFDDRKNELNRAKHGFSLNLAQLLFAGECKEKTDDRHDYGEMRIIATGPIGDRIFVCVYTWRNDIRRIISLRKANQEETDGYYQGQP